MFLTHFHGGGPRVSRTTTNHRDGAVWRAVAVECLESRRLLSAAAAVSDALDLDEYQPAKAPVPTGFLAGDGAAFGPRGGGLALNTYAGHACDALASQASAGELLSPDSAEPVPNAPTNLRATRTGNQLTLTWDDNSTDEDGFVVQQRGGFFQTFFPIAQTAANVNTLTIGMGNGLDFQFRVKAFNAGGESPNSNELRVVTAPDAPRVLQRSGVTTTSIRLDYTAAGATSFVIQRLVGGAWTEVGATTQFTFTEQNLPANSTHRYRIIARNDGGPSPAAETTASTVAPRPPNLRVTSVAPGRVGLAWDGVVGYVVFRVQRALDGVNFTTIGQLVPTITTFTDASAPANSTVRYRVVVFTGFSESPPSEVVTVNTPALDALREARDPRDEGGLVTLLS